MDIVYHSSDSFAPIMATSMASVFENNKDMEEINVYLIDNGLKPESLEQLNLLCEGYGRKLISIAVPDINAELKLGLKKIKDNWLFHSYCRLLLDHYLPETVERVLYLDGDVIAVSSLNELWNMDMQGRAVAAVADCLSENYYHLFELSSNAFYCNSGVILIDLQQWRKKRISAKVQQYIQEKNGYVFFMEQTVFNAVFQGEILLLPPKYNVTTTIMALKYSEVKTLRRSERFYSEHEISDAKKHPALVHMTSFFLVPKRAWEKGSTHPAALLYQQYCEKTPWGKKSISDQHESLKKKLLNFLVLHVPRPVLISFISFIYNRIRTWHIARMIQKYREV